MEKKYLSLLSLAVIMLIAIATGIFLIGEINKTYASPEFQIGSVSEIE